jgi:hypothetical protein
MDHFLRIVSLPDSAILGTYEPVKVIICYLRVQMSLIFSFVVNSSLLATIKRSHVDIHHLNLSIILPILCCILLQNLSYSVIQTICLRISLRSILVFLSC